MFPVNARVLAPGGSFRTGRAHTSVLGSQAESAPTYACGCRGPSCRPTSWVVFWHPFIGCPFGVLLVADRKAGCQGADWARPVTRGGWDLFSGVGGQHLPRGICEGSQARERFWCLSLCVYLERGRERERARANLSRGRVEREREPRAGSALSAQSSVPALHSRAVRS